MKRNDLYVRAMVSVFLLIFLWCPAMYALDMLDVINIEDLRNYKDPDKVYGEDEFLAGFFNFVEQGKASLHDIYTNYLPFYSQLVAYMQNADRNSRAKFLELMGDRPAEPKIDDVSETAEENTPKEEKPKIKVEAKLLYDDNFHRYYAFEPYQFLDRWIIGTQKSLRGSFDRQVENLNRLIASEPNVNFYVYILTRMQDTEYAIEIVPNEFSTIDFFYEFTYRVKAKGMGWFDIDTAEKRVERVFRTDHHWSAAGAYSGYLDVVGMMKENTPEIGDALPTNGETGLICFDEVKMRGSFAAVLRYEDYYEPFCVLDITLPAFTDPNVHIEAYDRYAAGKFDKSTFADHYSAYYNSSQQRHYSLQDKTAGRNLLVIGDSYSWWFNWLIAANFDNVYIYLPPWDQKNFNYSQFVAENGITDVLVAQFSDRLMFDYYSDNDFGAVAAN